MTAPRAGLQNRVLPLSGQITVLQQRAPAPGGGGARRCSHCRISPTPQKDEAVAGGAIKIV
jgi:hypothetical protein